MTTDEIIKRLSALYPQLHPEAHVTLSLNPNGRHYVAIYPEGIYKPAYQMIHGDTLTTLLDNTEAWVAAHNQNSVALLAEYGPRAA